MHKFTSRLHDGSISLAEHALRAGIFFFLSSLNLSRQSKSHCFDQTWLFHFLVFLYILSYFLSRNEARELDLHHISLSLRYWRRLTLKYCLMHVLWLWRYQSQSPSWPRVCVCVWSQRMFPVLRLYLSATVSQTLKTIKGKFSSPL